MKKMRTPQGKIVQLFMSTLMALLLNPVTLVYGGEVKVNEEVKINVSSEVAWALIGAFQGLDRWHPAVVSSTSEGNGMNAGDLRVLTLGNRAKIIERLVSYDDKTMLLEYEILKSPLPIENYVSSIRVKTGKYGSTKIIWSSTFQSKGASDEEAKKVIVGIYKAGFESLIKLFK